MGVRETGRRIARAGGVALRWELAIYANAWRWITRRYDVPPGATAFGYVGAVSVLLWALIAVSAIELVVLHLILPWETVRVISDIVGIWGLLWMIGIGGSFHVHPHLITDDGLRVRHGHAFDLVVPWSAVGTVGRRERSLERNRSLQVEESADRTILNVVVASRTELEVRLVEPVTVVVRGTSYAIDEVRLVADDTKEFARAIAAAATSAQAH